MKHIRSILYNAVQRNGGEFHNFPFGGVPEPATALLMLTMSSFVLRRASNRQR